MRVRPAEKTGLNECRLFSSELTRQGFALEVFGYFFDKDVNMLVLSRKERQTIRLGHEQIELKILEIHGRTVKIGITAPAHVPVMRSELCLDLDLAMQSVGAVCLPRC